MNLDRVIVLNPDYHFKNDTDRVVMYSTKHVFHDSSIDWIGYIHPLQAMILGLFTDSRPIKEHLSDLENHFHLSHDNIVELISPYINNPAPFYTEIGDIKILFPKNVLIPKEIISKESFHYDFDKSVFQCSSIDLSAERMHRSPQSLLFMLTNKCVTKCKYCYADKQKVYKPLNTNKILEIVEEAKKLQMSYIDIIGGEIFCRKDWDIILSKLVEYNLTPNYISTKVPITKTLVERLYKTGYQNVIQISLDSLREDVLQNIICCKAGYIKNILEGIELLQQYGFKIQIDTILTKFNSNQEQLTELFNYIRNIKQLIYWEIRVPEASIYTPNTFKEIKADKKELISICEFIKKTFIPNAKFSIYVSDDVLEDIFQKGTTHDECFKGGTCGILNNRLFVLPDGQVSVCEQLYWHPQFIIGDLNKQTLCEVWNSPKAHALFKIERESFSKQSYCTQCKAFDACNKQHRRCFVKVIKAYGSQNWDFPDPRCQYAPSFNSDLKY